MFANLLTRTIPAAMLIAIACPHGAMARVKLTTLPVRERVEVQLDHESATLVEEQRIVPLVAGMNQIDFSWANTSIDPHTIVFRLLEPIGNEDLKANVLSVSYPPNENALVWQVSSNASGSIRVRISYLLGGLSKSFTYRAVAANDEKTLTLRQYLRVKNSANEEYDDTEIHVGFGESFSKPLGLNETKELLVERFANVPVTKAYTCDPVAHGYIDRPQDKLRVPMHYVLTNDAKHGLGKAALPFGKVRLFQKDSAGTTAFIGEDWGQFTPLDDEMRIYVGSAQDVVVKRTIEKRDATKLGANMRRFDVVIKYEIENFKDSPVTLDVIEHPMNLRQEAGAHVGRQPAWVIGDQTTFTGGVDKKRANQNQVVHSVDLPARDGDKAKKITMRLHLVFDNQW